MTLWLGLHVFCRPPNRMSLTRSRPSAREEIWQVYKHLKWMERVCCVFRLFWDSPGFGLHLKGDLKHLKWHKSAAYAGVFLVSETKAAGDHDAIFPQQLYRTLIVLSVTPTGFLVLLITDQQLFRGSGRITGDAESSLCGPSRSAATSGRFAAATRLLLVVVF